MGRISLVVPFSEPTQDNGANGSTRRDLFRVQRKVMNIFGVWPGDHLVRRWPTTLFFSFNFFSLGMCITGEFLHGLYAFLDGNLCEAIESICPTIARMTGFIRLLFVLYNERKIERILSTLDKLVNEDHPRENETTNRLMALGHRLAAGIFIVTCFTAAFYGLAPFVTMAYNWYHGQRPLIKLLPFKTVLPYDTQVTSSYILTILYLNYISGPTISILSGSDALFSGICLYVSGQFIAIRHEAEALSATIAMSASKATSSETQRINQDLRRMNIRHQQIIDLAAQVRDAFAPNILFIYTCSAITMGIVSMAVFIVEGILRVIYLPYTISLVFLLFLYAYSGTVIRDSSKALQTAAYCFPWYRYNRTTRHLVQMMMIRAKYGCNLDVFCFEISLSSFSVILRTAVSYITLMKTFV